VTEIKRQWHAVFIAGSEGSAGLFSVLIIYKTLIEKGKLQVLILSNSLGANVFYIYMYLYADV
jgi:hypothetical protein